MGAGEKGLAGLLYRTHEKFAFVDGQRDRFLAIDGLACAHCRNGDRGVPVVRRGDHDSLHVIALQHFAIVVVDVRAEFRRQTGGMVFVHIADGHDFSGHVSQPPGASDGMGERGSLATGADYRESNRLAGDHVNATRAGDTRQGSGDKAAASEAPCRPCCGARRFGFIRAIRVCHLHSPCV